LTADLLQQVSNVDRGLSEARAGRQLPIVDHAEVAGSGSGSSATQDLHRIDEGFAISDIESHGFNLLTLWQGFRNASDELVRFHAALPRPNRRHDRLHPSLVG